MSHPHETLEKHYADDGKREFVGDLFNQGAPHYDRIGKIGFLGTGHIHRKRAVCDAGLKPGMKALDVACGTGAVTRAILEVLDGDGEVYCVDPSEGMMAEAQKAVTGPTYIKGEAEHLPFEDDTFDFLSMGYALRHVENLDATFAEYRRVLKPGGRMMILEISRPNTAMGMFWSRLYFKNMLPTISFIITGNKDAKKMMSYYWDTIDACVPPQSILDAVEKSGFQGTKRSVELGIFSSYQAHN